MEGNKTYIDGEQKLDQGLEVKKMYIDGEWVLSDNGTTKNILNPANGETVAVISGGNEEDAKKAISAARRAFYKDGWKNSPAKERARLLHAVANKLEERAEEFGQLETLNNGKPLRESIISVHQAVDCFRYYAGLITKPHGQTYNTDPSMQSMVVREPLGVCALILSWNFPILSASWKLAPALAAGNTVILKPAEITPLSAIKLFEIFEEVGFPKGVVNLVLGPGRKIGQELASSHEVDKISFTGGTETGKGIMREAAGNLKKISLELGGKSPLIVFDDADFEAAVDYALFGIFFLSGQVCNAASRLLLEESIHDKFIARLVERAQQIKVGDGMDPETEMGPLVSKEHMNKILSYINIGKEEGATIACGGNQITTDGFEQGNFVQPTIFTNTKPDMRIVQEEIFGPVLVVQKFKGEEEALELANNSIYGLAGAVFTNDGAKAQRVIRGLEAGITWINSYHMAYNEAPWGGYKQSGIGRELGTFGYDSFTEIKQINTSLAVQPIGWYKN